MISERTVRRYCKEYWKIENYQEAVNDTTQMWDCHHRRETEENLSREELITIGCYYDVHYSELIFLTPAEHHRLHMEGENNPMYGKGFLIEGENNPMYGKGFLIEGENNPMYGKHLTEEHKAKISESKKGRLVGENNPNYGKHHAEEVKHRIRECNIGNQNALKYYITEEELYDLYVVQGLSVNKIAAMYGCGQCTIYNKLKKFNIKKHK